MTITKYHCDFCEKEFNPNRKYTLEAQIVEPEAWAGDRTKIYKGEFCSRACAIRFMEMDGEKAIKAT